MLTCNQAKRASKGGNNLNQQNLNILLLTHGKAGEALIESAEMIAGKLDNVNAISLMPGIAPEKYTEEVRKELSGYCGETIIFCDIFGGTPSYVAAELSVDFNISLFSGLNLAMLLEACISKNVDNIHELVASIKRVGDTSCVLVQSEALKKGATHE